MSLIHETGQPSNGVVSVVRKGKDPALDALFLFADDDTDVESGRTSLPVTRDSVEDEDEEELRYEPLAPALDLVALAREAETRHARGRVSGKKVTGSQETSSPPDKAETNANVATEEGEGEKARRGRANLDEERLVSSCGFPQLMKDVQGFKPKGKGHEVSPVSSSSPPPPMSRCLYVDADRPWYVTESSMRT